MLPSGESKGFLEGPAVPAGKSQGTREQQTREGAAVHKVLSHLSILIDCLL